MVSGSELLPKTVTGEQGEAERPTLSGEADLTTLSEKALRPRLGAGEGVKPDVVMTRRTEAGGTTLCSESAAVRFEADVPTLDALAAAGRFLTTCCGAGGSGSPLRLHSPRCARKAAAAADRLWGIHRFRGSHCSAAMLRSMQVNLFS